MLIHTELIWLSATKAKKMKILVFILPSRLLFLSTFDFYQVNNKCANVGIACNRWINHVQASAKKKEKIKFV